MNTEQIMALIADLRSRINPAYATQPGTESYERRLCAEAIEALVQERDGLRIELADANDGIKQFAYERDKAIRMRNEAEAELAEIKAQEPVAWLCCVPGQDAVLLFDEPSDERYPPGYKEALITRSKS